MEKLIADDSKINLDIALAGAVCAKNSLAMNNGFSPIQLVTASPRGKIIKSGIK